MNIIQEILKSQNGQIVGQLAKQFGLDSGDAVKAVSNLIPAIAGGVKKTAQSKNNLENLIAKVERNQELRNSLNNPGALEKPATTEAGNEILGDIFGSKDVSRTVAKQTAESTGLDLGILKKMLPLIAGLVMSSLNQRGESSTGGLGGLLGGLAGNTTQQTQTSGLGGLLSRLLGGGRRKQKNSSRSQSGGLESFLDFDGDGNIADDVLNLARKLF